ncbi:MAG: tetratricopeptide repeat protein [Pseudomonadota bacterium]
MFRRFPLWTALAAVVFVAACDTAEERAEGHFESGQALYDAGDVTRAIIELRNVFKLDSGHRDARLLMAKIEEERGNLPGAYAHMSALTENEPENFDAHRAAGRIAADIADWKSAERHAEAARALLADDQDDAIVSAIELGIAYQEARLSQDPETAQQLADQTALLLAANPDVQIARRVMIEHYLFRQDWEAALSALDAGLAQAPDERILYRLRLAVLEQLGRLDEIEKQLRDMVARFADDESLRELLVRWYINQNRIADAEQYLRAQIDPSESDPEAQMILVGFISQVRGNASALEEIEAILAETPQESAARDLYRAARAGLIFDGGERDAAIAEMQDIVATATASDQTRRIKIILARMLVETGNPVGARALVEEVLVEDETNVDGLKLRAGWLIEDDQPDEALIELRRALDQAPRDADVLTLMAQAQERSGSRELMGEMLALAVESSGQGKAESLRYAAFLSQDDRLLPAERVLVDALRARPNDLDLLRALGSVYIALEDFSRAQGVVDAFGRIDDPQALALSDALTAQILSAQDRNVELQSFLERMAVSQEGSDQAIAAAIRLRLAQGDSEGALEYLEERLAENPDNPNLRLLSVGLFSREGRQEEALTTLEALVEEFPQNEQLRVALYNLHRRNGDSEAARAVLATALGAMPDASNLLWAQATELEQSGDIDGAIAVYERLYAENSSAPIVANNLASLIATYREDDESLQRAFTIARRLRGTDVPQFQDTYGWIAARLGNVEEALIYLEPAAAALDTDPAVQFHLARAYDMAGRTADALAAFQTVQALLQDTTRPYPFRDRVTAEIARLEAAVPAAEN